MWRKHRPQQHAGRLSLADSDAGTRGFAGAYTKAIANAFAHTGAQTNANASPLAHADALTIAHACHRRHSAR